MSQASSLPPQLGWRDASGRLWPTFLDVPAVVRLKAAGYDIKDNDRLAAIFADSYDAADFAVAVHRPAWEAAELTEADFLALMTDHPERLTECFDAVVAGLIDFFLRFRDVLRAGVVRKAIEAAELANQSMTQKLSSPKVDDAIRAELARRMADVDDNLDQIISGETSGSSLASSDSPPTVLPYDPSLRRSRENALPRGITLPHYSPHNLPNRSTPTS